ncbi:bifunctional adenosylcobinamide kinase/adenosylcobinamide-phosphate guanylyltransferase [Acerihabitans arboris]|uniref:Bifunctional adenosylcobalamin biosynthesis protein n=1 Tax=Acerihabitans arboris TaxID=2691583 RepID=A0A845SKM7_9GAMM|nr:bifunctional adenosylcobinamide kinase/adenosylcobinamide-phosphate guanylyltransferase [Acerihabitans arboris]NDL63171.1 bifunctional adenosylcobinamide kinase/adenosylcobinamide-phosphate guanylyltransferase [Acerihabitans arboris]
MMLVTGGARSGKSRLAETLAARGGGAVLYIATSLVTDDEMARRVEQHRRDRPAHWLTWEGHCDLDRVIRDHADRVDAVLLECVTTLITNLLFDRAGDAPPEAMDFVAIERHITGQIDALIAACAGARCPVVLVTNELGMGIVPENLLARRFRDIAGRVNQRLAAAATDVWLVVSGIPVPIKGNAGHPLNQDDNHHAGAPR